MLPATLLLLCVAALEARAQATTTTTSSSSSSSDTSNVEGGNGFYSTTFSTLSSFTTPDFSGSDYTYLSYTGQSTVDTSTTENGTRTSSSSGSSSSGSQSTQSTTSQSLTLLGGGTRTSTGTASSTSSGPAATNTVPCNGYPEFCQRQYSNITEVCAHNSAFVVPNNAGSNQLYGIIDQLNDGVRMLQGETHWVNETIYNCHTSCNLLNAGPWQSSLELVANWLDSHPFDVVTWLIVNSDFRQVEDYLPAIQNSGIQRYLYEPSYIPQHRDQWPTLAEMILSGKRMVLFMDYNANQTAVPFIMDEFTHIWETPFSPVDRGFPCTQQRPPGLRADRAREDFMYLANHNLNTAVDLRALLGGGATGEILIPNTYYINQTNGQLDEYSQLERMRLNCTEQWVRPPNFLLVDYYNFGDPEQGSVFEVAARANNVTYNRQPCCGPRASTGNAVRGSAVALVVAVVFAVLAAC